MHQTILTPGEGPTLYSLKGNPTTHTWDGANLATDSLLVDTSENELYRKTGAGASDWTLLGAVSRAGRNLGPTYASSLRRYSVVP